jgi:hypothetical protein
VLQRLAAALDNYDMSAATAAVAALGTSGFPAWGIEDVDRLRLCVDEYEFGEARSIAVRLLAGVTGADADVT